MTLNGHHPMQHLAILDRDQIAIAAAESAALGPGDVRVRVAYAAVCHSDIAQVAEGRGPYPLHLGHETSGVVIESAAPDVAVGTRVACYSGGGYASEVVLPASSVIALDEECRLLDAALSEPLACVIGGIEMLDLARASSIALVGSGFMGLLALRYLTSLGFRVTVVEQRGSARELAVRWGAAQALDPAALPSDLVNSFAVVIEATGSASGLQLASELCAIAATLGILGYHQSGGGLRETPMRDWNYKALRVMNLHHRDAADVMRWMDRAQRMSAVASLRPSDQVDRIVTLEDLPGLFSSTSPTNAVKTVAEVWGEDVRILMHYPESRDQPVASTPTDKHR